MWASLTCDSWAEGTVRLQPGSCSVTALGSWSCSGQWAVPSRAEMPASLWLCLSVCMSLTREQWSVCVCCLIVKWLASFLCPSRNPSFSCCITRGAFLLSFLTSSSSVRSPLSPRLCSNWQSCNLVAAVLYCLSLIGIRGCWQSPAIVNWLIDLLQSLPGFCLTNRSVCSFWNWKLKC